MSRTALHVVVVRDLPNLVQDPQRGVFSLVGGHGGLSLIVGDISESGLVMGSQAIETEHGTVYLDLDSTITVSEEIPYDSDHDWIVSWAIDAQGATPEHAAMNVWQTIFGRSVAFADDACVFTVTDPQTKKEHRVDLSEATVPTD